jgi:hypothetical protein
MQKLDAAQIPFSLNPGRRLFKPIMEGQSLEWAVGQLHRDKRTKNIKPNIGLVTAFEPYAKQQAVAWFRECELHRYPVGSVVIPVRPAGYWADSGKLHVLWPQCWKGRTLDTLQRAIFNTILRAAFFVGDFKSAKLEWVDLREQSPRGGRALEVLNSEQLGTVSADDFRGYLDILIQAFEQHSAEKTRRRAEERPAEDLKSSSTPLFGGYLPRSPRRGS